LFNKAKEIYFDYLGNEFFMWKDGVLEEYKSYDVSKDQEILWRNELIENLYSVLNVKHESSLGSLILIINYFGDYNLLKDVLNFISNNYKEADSFLKLKYAEYLFDVIEKSDYHEQWPKNILLETGEIIRNIIYEILNNKIEIIDESEKILEFNHDMPDENYLILRTQELFKRVQL
jgi:hypothetical protein